MKNIISNKWSTLIVFLSVLVFCSVPLWSRAQESSSKIDSQTIETATSSSELVASSEASPALDPTPMEAEAKNATPEAVMSKDMVEMILGAQEELPKEVPEEIKVDDDAVHSCSLEDFSKKAQRNQDITFTYSIFTPHPEKIVKNSYYLGELPHDVSGEIAGAASKEGLKYNVRLTIGERAQKGSFNIVVFYQETDNTEKTSTSVCQFNLIVE